MTPAASLASEMFGGRCFIQPSGVKCDAIRSDTLPRVDFNRNNWTKSSATRDQIVAVKVKLLQVRAKCDGVVDIRSAMEAKCKAAGQRPSAAGVSRWLSIPPNTATIVALLAALVAHRCCNLTADRCLIGNNYVVMEISRPLTDCRICSKVKGVKVLNNPSKQEFSLYAYSGQPVLVTGATGNWTAMTRFNFDFFKQIYDQTRGAHDSVDQECQFFPFRSEFVRLRDVFAMPPARANMTDASVPWYIGWSNCHPDVADVLRQHYTRPHFLPSNSESSAIDWIFMGFAGSTGRGSSMHLDYVQRPSWQSQIRGRKTWNLLPPPECEAVCHAFNVTVNTGDIILIDTNQWYHDTQIHAGDISITIGSEYD